MAVKYTHAVAKDRDLKFSYPGMVCKYEKENKDLLYSLQNIHQAKKVILIVKFDICNL